MSELTETQKQDIAMSAVKDIEMILNLHGMTMTTLDKKLKGVLIDVYIAGATMVQNKLKEIEKEVQHEQAQSGTE
jgi:hypothetical protein